MNNENNGWQSIETAPKDGRVIITCRIISGESRVFSPEINTWNDPKKTGLGSLGWWNSSKLMQPTHWMPVPNP